ncbi:hypothetical protein KO481_37005 [Nocardia sp. NEAU-G5]|uniref:Uncharacterized protein n=1 Tax=Nocardia albiluteola TaxID=2842303 RepID=A0ABS6B9Y4_9NOCA|nr:hypothetical protein [Nocardia albiluteola]MBU3067107.1 hypothetical protein [Nocardia albiluteola]
MKQQFATLADGAGSGQLIIEDGVADKCIQHCQNHLVDLKALIDRAQLLVHVDAFGDLNSAKYLANKFDTLGSGEAGSGSFGDAVSQRIAVIQQMEEMFKKARDAFKNSDEATKDKIRQAMKNLDA